MKWIKNIPFKYCTNRASSISQCTSYRIYHKTVDLMERFLGLLIMNAMHFFPNWNETFNLINNKYVTREYYLKQSPCVPFQGISHLALMTQIFRNDSFLKYKYTSFYD